MKKILVLSDVHGNKKVLEDILYQHKDADYKIYLGDFQMSATHQKEYSSMFDYVVTGNCDYTGISDITIFPSIEGKKLLITHGHYFGSMTAKIKFSDLYELARENDCSFILHGHDHIAVIEEKDGITRFNPGSTTFPRNNINGSYGLITIDEDNNWTFEHIYV